MRIIVLFLTVFLIAACVTEVKPLLKPVETDIPDRIANMQKWLANDLAAKSIDRDEAKPVQEKLNKIKEKYERLQSSGALTPKASEEIKRDLDQTSDLIFRLDLKKKKAFKGVTS